MTNENKNAIDRLNKDNLVIVYKFLKYLVEYNKVGARERPQVIEMISYIENKMNHSNIGIPNNGLTETEFNQARRIYSSMQVSNTRNDDMPRSGILDGILGIGGIILIVIIYALVKGAVDIIVDLWNQGILKVVLGVAGAGILIYFISKKVSSNKTKEEKQEHIERTNTKTYENSQSNNKEKVKEKENSSNVVVSTIKSGIKGLTVFSSTVAVFGTGFAHLNKYSPEFNTTPFEGVGKGCRKIYENVGRFIRETGYEYANDYSEYENMGYMNYVDPSIAENWYNLDYENDDYCFFIKADFTWESLSQYCYGNIDFAEHLRLYNCRFDCRDDIIYPGDVVFVPNPTKLENYIYVKRLIKK